MAKFKSSPSRNASRQSRGDPRQRALAWLRDHGSPRLVMSLMLASTIGCGFITSVTLHRIGLGAPIVRYPLAVLAGWAVFLVLVSVWVWWQRRENARADERTDVARSSWRGGKSSSDWSGGLGSGGSSSSSGSGGSSWGGGGGRFGGGGARGSFADGPGDGLASGLVSSGSSGSGPAMQFGGGGGGFGGGSGGDGKGGDWGFDLDGDGDFLVLLIGIVVVAAAVFGVAFYAVYSAPTFFAELLIDGGVGTWLYKRADVVNRPDWLSTAVRRSVLPVVVLLVLFIALALTMQHVAPAATTLGQAWNIVLAK